MWTDDLFGNQKPVIGMVHIQALPGTVLYDGKAGLESVLANARQDYESLAEGGISGVIFCNEFDKPYSMGAESHIVASMTHIIDEVRRGAKDIPFGVDIQWDPKAALAVARATGASFIRGIVCGTYCGDYGLLTPDTEGILAYRHKIGADAVKILTNLVPEFSSSLDTRDICLRARTAVKSSLVEGLCVSGVMAGTRTPYEQLRSVKECVREAAVFANTGVDFDSVAEILRIADGCCVATCLKKDAVPANRIDAENEKRLMEKARKA